MKATNYGTRETGLVVALFDAQQSACFHCGRTMLRGVEQERDPAHGWSRDHLIARDGNGGQRSDFWLLAHPVCNNARGNTPLSAIDYARAQAIWAMMPAQFIRSIRTKPKVGRDIKRNPYRWFEPKGAPNAQALGKLADFWPML